MNPGATPGPLGFRVIGAMKVATAVLLAISGVGILRLLDEGLGGTLERFVTRLHLDPENRVVHALIARVSSIDPKQLKALSAGTFFYAALEAVEGTGLLLQKRWAEYLTILATASLMPVEVYEIMRKPGPLRIVVLLVNLAVVIYLVVKLIEDRRSRAKGSTAAVRTEP